MLSSGRRSIAAGSFVPNLLVGTIFETIPNDSVVKVAMLSATAAADPTTGLIAQVTCDSDMALQDVNEPNLTVKATAPIEPDDFLLRLVCVAGSKLYLQVRNNSVGAIVCFYAVTIEPLL